MKVWHVGGPLHGLVQEIPEVELHRNSNKLALDDASLNVPFEERKYKQIAYHLEKFQVGETDAQQLRYANHHVNYFLSVYIDNRLSHSTAKQMLMELILLDYMRQHGEKM